MSVSWKDVLAKGAAMAKESLDFVKKEFQESTREDNEDVSERENTNSEMTYLFYHIQPRSCSICSTEGNTTKILLQNLKEDENSIQVMKIPKADTELIGCQDFLKFFESIPEFSGNCNWRIRFKVPYSALQKNQKDGKNSNSSLYDYVWLDLPSSKRPPMYQGNFHVKITEEKIIRNCDLKAKQEVRTTLPNPSAKIPPTKDRPSSSFNEVFSPQEASTPDPRKRADQDFDPSQELSTLLKDWGSNPDGSLKDLRTLLSTLQDVLWENSGWEAVKVSELMLSQKHVKVVFRKAMFTCHPDKIKSSDSETAWRAQLVFSTLTDANEVFKNSNN